MDIQELRNRIDRVDDELVRLYGERMELAREIGRYKRENGIPVLDTERERNLLNRVGEKAGKENENGGGRRLFPEGLREDVFRAVHPVLQGF